MPKKKYTDSQIALVVKEVAGGANVQDLSRKLGVSEQTISTWKKRFSGMGAPEIRKLRQLEEENRKLKQLVAELSLDKVMLQDILSKKD